jgi:hypothetical protein
VALAVACGLWQGGPGHSPGTALEVSRVARRAWLADGALLLIACMIRTTEGSGGGRNAAVHWQCCSQ